MAIKSFKPTTPSRRQMTVTDYSSLSKVAPERSLLESLKTGSGRNSYGRITVRHRGGANRRKYRIIDFKRDKANVPATVLTLEYDPNRSAHIALLQYEDGEKRYIIMTGKTGFMYMNVMHLGRSMYLPCMEGECGRQ